MTPLPLPQPKPDTGMPLPLPQPKPDTAGTADTNAPEPLPLPPAPSAGGQGQRPSLQYANQRRAQAREARARALVQIQFGNLTVAELLNRAGNGTENELRRITLSQLLLATGRSKTEASTLLHRLQELAGTNAPARKLTVAWLLDGRSGPRRLVILQDLLAPRTKPWPGYPWAPNPNPDLSIAIRTDSEGVAE